MEINIARFDLVSMRLAVLCAESGSLSAAAKRAHCSISAGSQRLSSLESSLGKALFVRDYRGLKLTEAGALFVRHARTILGHLEILREQVAAADAQDASPGQDVDLEDIPAPWRPYDAEGATRSTGALVREGKMAA